MTYQAQVSIPYFTGLPEDVVTNVWHFDWGGIVSPVFADFVALTSVLDDFYNDIYGSVTVGQMAPWMRPLLTRIKVYDLLDPTPRVPVFQAAMPLTVSTSAVSSTAPEVAIVMSFQGDPISGVNQARRRGRVYLGGWGLIADNGTASTFPEPLAAAEANIAGAGATLITAGSIVDWLWVVWSRVGQVSTQVTNGWVDNALDTQRRRGQQATARTLF